MSLIFSVWMVITAIAVLSFSGLPVLLFSSRSVTGQRLAAFFMCAGSAVGLAGTIMSFSKSSMPIISLPWFLPLGKFEIALDGISLLFLIPIFIVPALGSIYGLSYWKQSEHLDNGRRLVFFYGLLAGSMALIVIAHNAVLFLVAWEIMALAAYFAATAENDNAEVCRAGWIYLVATHIGTLCLIAMFILWRYATNSFSLYPVEKISVSIATVIFILSLIGFGFKAGIMPFHIWLPGAHANAPSHVSAVMSGVMLKLGIYGIVRMTALLGVAPIWWASSLLILGVITGIAGILFAVSQNDIKRILAYSSIENIGIIIIGLGLALLGRSLNQPKWIMLGLGGALLHVWNHSLFKSLLFFNAGTIIHASHTREIDRMGGLAKQMPKTMLLFVIGAVAICALPPLNGFASEWLIYSGLFHTLGIDGSRGFPAAAIAVIALAMIGALAIACFVKVLGVVFLGSWRSDSTIHAHDPSKSMMIPMGITACGCIIIGLFPTWIIKLLESAATAWAPISDDITISASAPLSWISIMNLSFILLLGIIIFAFKKLMQNRIVTKTNTWDCGYAKPSARIQYTGSSFGQILVNLFAFILLPKSHKPDIRGLFPTRESFKKIVHDTILDRLLLPLFHAVGRFLPSFRILQQGQTHLYILYILLMVIILLICAIYGFNP